MDRDGDSARNVFSRSLRFWAMRIKAVETARPSLDEATDLGNPLTIAYAMDCNSILYLQTGDRSTAEEFLDRLTTYAKLDDLLSAYPQAVGWRRILEISRGDASRGNELPHSALAARPFGQELYRSVFLSSVIGDFVVAYVEWSGGRSDSLLSQALARQAMPHADDTEFRSHLSTGVTFTTAKKLIFTLELEYNGSGLNKAAWRNLMGGSFDNTYLLYRNWLQLALEPPTKEAAFFYATWQDVAINHLDLAAMERIDAVDHSRLSWLEWRYHLTHIELALQWQVNTGQSLSDYGALPQRRNWQGILRYYF
jgi:hypothetical protein